MNLYIRTFLLSGLLLTSSFAWGQDDRAMKLTLDKALRVALDRNKQIRIAQLEVKKSQAQLMEARSNLLPKLNASGQYLRNIEKPVMFLPPGTPFGSDGGPAILEIGYDNSYTGTVSATLPLFSNAIYSGIRLSKRGVELSEEAYHGSKMNIITDVKKAFYGVLLAGEVKDLTNMSFENAEENLENVRRLQQQGLVAEYDFIRADVQVENLRPLVLRAENNYELAKNRLRITIGLDASRQIEIEGELAYEKPIEVLSLEEALQKVMANNSSLRLLDIQVAMLREAVTLERSSHFPSLAVYGNYQYQTQANNFQFSDYTWVKTMFIGLQLQVPIFNGFGTMARVNQAKLSLSQAEEQQKAFTEAIKTQLESVIYRIEQAKKSIEGQTKAITQAELGYDIAKSRYTNGLGTQLEVNDADLALMQARVNYVQSVYDYKVALTDYEQLRDSAVR